MGFEVFFAAGLFTVFFFEVDCFSVILFSLSKRQFCHQYFLFFAARTNNAAKAPAIAEVTAAMVPVIF